MDNWCNPNIRTRAESLPSSHLTDLRVSRHSRTSWGQHKQYNHRLPLCQHSTLHFLSGLFRASSAGGDSAKFLAIVGNVRRTLWRAGELGLRWASRTDGSTRQGERGDNASVTVYVSHSVRCGGVLRHPPLPATDRVLQRQQPGHRCDLPGLIAAPLNPSAGPSLPYAAPAPVLITRYFPRVSQLFAG